MLRAAPDFVQIAGKAQAENPFNQVGKSPNENGVK